MFSHVVIFWTKPELPNAADALLEGAEKYLQPIPLAKSFHIGRMVPSTRPVVDQSYQVALNLTFEDKEAEAAYQVHPPRVRGKGLQAELPARHGLRLRVAAK